LLLLGLLDRDRNLGLDRGLVRLLGLGERLLGLGLGFGDRLLDLGLGLCDGRLARSLDLGRNLFLDLVADAADDL
jgi:hypothetical protein